MADSSSQLGLEFADSLHRALGDAVADEPVQTGQFCSTQWARFSELGATSLLVSEGKGGIGASLEDFLAVAVELGQLHSRFPAIESVIGHWLAAESGLTLSDAGITTIGLKLKPQHDQSDDQILTLANVPWGRYAQTIVVVDASGDMDAPARLAVVNSPKVDIQTAENLAREARDTLRISNEINFTQAAASGHGLLELLALGRAAQMVGIMQTLVRLTADYVSNRQQFGRPLSRFQAIQHNLATMYAETMSASVATRAALRGHTDQIASFDACAAIIQAREAATKIAACSHQAHGAMGFTEEYDLAEYSRRLWAWRDEYQTEAWWQERLGSILLGSDDSLLQQLSNASG